MSELYLIAHKVRGEPAFDVAQRMECPHCEGKSSQEYIDGPMHCHECDETGYWWIIPTSGHRAYPYGWQPLSAIELAPGFNLPMPENWPDHYTTSAAPTRTLADMLGFLNAPLTRRAPPIKRRF